LVGWLVGWKQRVPFKAHPGPFLSCTLAPPQVKDVRGREQQQPGDGAAAAAPAQAPVTPFARASVHRAVGNSGGGEGGGEGGQLAVMTVEAVDRALDDVRPYLIADGGNVDVVGVENGRVFLQLQV
jgi:hypothetical protein